MRITGMVSLRRVVLIAAVSATIAAAACGCGTAGEQTVATVAGVSKITKALVEHWMHIAGVRNYQLRPLSPPPSGAIPDPPNYERCIAFLRKLAEGHFGTPLVKAGKPTKVPVLTQCVEQYEALRAQALAGLITGFWLIDEAKARGLIASASAIDRYVGQFERSGYENRAEFQRSIAYSGETRADLLLRAKIKVYSRLLEEQFAKNGRPALENPAFVNFLLEFPKRWAAKTSCRADWVVFDCKEYVGRQPAEAVLL